MVSSVRMLSSLVCQSDKGHRLYESWVRDHVLHLGLNVSSSVHNCECVVYSGNTMAAI